ncbi:hypothetical protein ACWEOZ_13285 [Actinoplanes sp. NPDC004185]
MEWIIGIGSSIIASTLIFLGVRANGFMTRTARQRAQRRQLASRMLDAGLTNLFITRADYATYRGIHTLMGFLATAERSIMVIGYWMAQGSEIEDISKIGRMILQKPALQVRIAIIHPDGSHLESLAEHLGEDQQQISERCRSTLNKLQRVRSDLPADARQRLQVKTYTSTPVVSIIVLDDDTPQARAQVDMKLYRTARDDSFGFEVSGLTNPLYQRFRGWAVLRFEKAQEWPA